jgi:hypothetical protein
MLIFLYEVHVYNLDVIIILKLGCCGSPKNIILITTSLTSINCIDAHKSPKNMRNQYLNGVNSNFSMCNQVSSQESEGSHNGHT